MVWAYYNEFDPFAAEWLRRLVTKGLIPNGVVDERPIQSVSPDELTEFTQCHFFAGIGGWSLALKLANWPEEREVWTGSCPCQPFSNAGKRKTYADDRHLWPYFFRLIQQRKPATVFGEQVASAAGRDWLSRIRIDLENTEYAFGAFDLPAASVGAPHKRQRLWWVADSSRGSQASWLEHSNQPRLEGRPLPTESINQQSPWATSVAVPCADGTYRRIEPGIEPLANGIPGRVGRLRAYGNAIVPQVAEAVIKAYLACRP